MIRLLSVQLISVFVIFVSLTQFSSPVFTIDASLPPLLSMNYMLLKGGGVPISGMTIVGTVITGSVIRCATECNRLSSNCTSFIFQPNTPTCQQETSAGIGACQLMYFTDPDDVILGPATGCNRLFIADLCSHDASNQCMNSGTCSMTRWPKICTCPRGYGGTHCEISMCKFFSSSSHYSTMLKQ
jgi:hypothetical protein